MLIFITDESIDNISSFIKELFSVCVSKTRENVSRVLSAKFFVLSNQRAKIQLYGMHVLLYKCKHSMCPCRCSG